MKLLIPQYIPSLSLKAAVAMFGYMTEIDKVTPSGTEVVLAEGDDMLSLLYHFLDEWLFVFSAEPFFIPRVRETSNKRKICIYFLAY